LFAQVQPSSLSLVKCHQIDSPNSLSSPFSASSPSPHNFSLFELKLIIFVSITSINIININMSSHIPGNVSTYNEASAPLLERLKRKRSHMPFDYKTAFNKLLDLAHDDDNPGDCIDAADELLKQQLPESYRMRTHIVLATCLEDLDEMEEHHEEALRIWTRLKARSTAGEIPNDGVWLQQTRAQIDCLWDTIEEERNIETDESDESDDESDDDLDGDLDGELDDTDSASTPKLSMSAITAIETVPVLNNATSGVMNQPGRPQTSARSSMSAVTATETVPVLDNATSVMSQPGCPQTPAGTSSNRSSSASDDDSESSGAATSDSEDTSGRIRGTRSTDVSPARSASLSASSVHSGLSRLFGAIALPGQNRGLTDRIGMSPAAVLRLAWNTNRTVRDHSIKQPSKKLPSSSSESPTPTRRGTE
jgi:hypothetical protein